VLIEYSRFYERPGRERNKKETKPWHSIEYCAKEHISRFEFATKMDRGPEFIVLPIQHLRSLYSCPLASLAYTAPHSLIDLFGASTASSSSCRLSPTCGSGSYGSLRVTFLKRRHWVSPEEAPRINFMVPDAIGFSNASSWHFYLAIESPGLAGLCSRRSSFCPYRWHNSSRPLFVCPVMRLK